MAVALSSIPQALVFVQGESGPKASLPAGASVLPSSGHWEVLPPCRQHLRSSNAAGYPIWVILHWPWMSGFLCPSFLHVLTCK